MLNVSDYGSFVSLQCSTNLLIENSRGNCLIINFDFVTIAKSSYWLQVGTVHNIDRIIPDTPCIFAPQPELAIWIANIPCIFAQQQWPILMTNPQGTLILWIKSFAVRWPTYFDSEAKILFNAVKHCIVLKINKVHRYLVNLSKNIWRKIATEKRIMNHASFCFHSLVSTKIGSWGEHGSSYTIYFELVIYNKNE